jgi:hypothetical protein
MFRQKVIKLPDELRKLQKPWFEKPIDPVVERLIRGGGSVQKAVHPGEWIMTEWRSGSAGTILGGGIAGKTAALFFETKKREYFSEDNLEGVRIVLEKNLEELLRKRGMELKIKGTLSCELLRLTCDIIKILPKSHFGHAHFIRLVLGEWHSGVYKGACGSAYDDPGVYIFPYATNGPKRNYVAFLLHEIGHSFQELINAEDLLRLGDLYDVRKFSVDYNFGKEEREARQGTLAEFIAENYMHYVTQWENLDAFIRTLDAAERQKWGRILAIYMRYFDGIQYV